MEEKRGINRVENEDEFEEETIEEPVDEEADSMAEEEPEEETKETPPADTSDEAEEKESSGQVQEEAGNDTSAKSSPFRRKEKKDKKDEQIDELNDKVRRQMAEFDNYRKRTEKEKSQMFETGAKSVIEKILPVIDNFERGLDSIPEDERDTAFVEGMDKIYRQMMAVLDEIGVKVIEAEGLEFNPEFHNAVMHVEDEDAGENMVVQELQKGYTYRDSVVRHSMVKVAN